MLRCCSRGVVHIALQGRAEYFGTVAGRLEQTFSVEYVYDVYLELNIAPYSYIRSNKTYVKSSAVK